MPAITAKRICFATIGTRFMKEGIRLVASHIDSPGGSLKPNPLYEDAEISSSKPIIMGVPQVSVDGNSAVFAWRDCEKRWRSCCGFGGEEPGEPVFSITDLLPHLSEDCRMPANWVTGCAARRQHCNWFPAVFRDDKASQKVKLAIAKLLLTNTAL